MEPTRIDWGSASVDDGSLSVALEGEPSKEWVERVERVIERLHAHGGDSGWGEIKVSKKKLTVADVADGAESDLRHLLESAVLQANADLAPDDDDDSDGGNTDERSEADQQMTDAFRAFAPPDGDSDDDSD